MDTSALVSQIHYKNVNLNNKSKYIFQDALTVCLHKQTLPRKAIIISKRESQELTEMRESYAAKRKM